MDPFSLPTTGPASRAPARNPYLDEIDAAAQNAHMQLSPGAQKALQLAGAPLPQQAPAPTPIGGPSAPPPTLAATPKPQAPGAPIVPPPPKAPGQVAAEGEFGRLTKPDTGMHNRQNTGTAGVNQIKSPWARVPLQIASALAETFAPRLATAIPGTESHHQLLIGQQENAIRSGEESRKAEGAVGLQAAQQGHAHAQAEQEMSQIPLNQARTEESLAKPEAAADKLAAQGLRDQATQQHQQDQDETRLRQLGYKRDPATREIVPVSYDELSPDMQAVHDLKAAQAEAASATAELKKAQATNQPQVMALQQARLDHANRATVVASQRLGLSQQQFEMRAFGTNKGEPLPGALLTDEGQPVGSAQAANVRPTGQERNKADLASSAHEQLQDLKSIVQKRQDIFGPAAGRKTEFSVWVGSQDPDAQAFRAARTIAGDHLAGVFGGRSEAALSALDSAIGHFKDNPAAIISGLDQLDKANNRFVQVGTPRTVGSNRVSAESVDPNVKAFADEFFSGDIKKAQAEIDRQRGGKK